MLAFILKVASRKNNDFQDDVVEIERSHEENDEALKVALCRMITYAESADIKLQKEVAERLANEAVHKERQTQIVEYGGLRLLIPLSKSHDDEVRRLAAHALANLSVNASNQEKMAHEGAIDILICLLEDNSNELTIRQAAKALANLAVRRENKLLIKERGGIPTLVRAVSSSSITVKTESIAALANLAVLDENEIDIISAGALPLVIDALISAGATLKSGQNSSGNSCRVYDDLAAQCARIMRNLSSADFHRQMIIELGGLSALQSLAAKGSGASDSAVGQAKRTIKILQ